MFTRYTNQKGKEPMVESVIEDPHLAQLITGIYNPDQPKITLRVDNLQYQLLDVSNPDLLLTFLTKPVTAVVKHLTTVIYPDPLTILDIQPTSILIHVPMTKKLINIKYRNIVHKELAVVYY